MNICKWSTATIADMSKMLRAHYKGKINIWDYWEVGATKRITLNEIPATDMYEGQPEQEVELVILGFDHDKLAIPSQCRINAAVTIQVRDCLVNNGPMMYVNNIRQNSDSISWSASQLREWCNNNFKEALPDILKEMVKPVIKHTRTRRDPNDIIIDDEWSIDECFLLSTSEICKKPNYENEKQYPYMTSWYNRVKSIGLSSSGKRTANPATWYTRTPNNVYLPMTNSKFIGFDAVRSGSATKYYVDITKPNQSMGIAPALCL
jgi:hypothetical protein